MLVSIVTSKESPVTSEESPVATQDAEIIHERSEDSLHGPEHGAEPQVEQHQEKQSGPEGTGREEGHHLSERYERQACALNPLCSNEREDGKNRERKFV